MTLDQVPPLRRDWGVDNTRNSKRPRDGGSDRDCWEFSNRGKCTRRDCKYEHVQASGADAERKRRRTPRSPTRAPYRAPHRAPAHAPTGMFCKYHRSGGHNTRDCKTIRDNPTLQHAYASDLKSQSEAINAMNANNGYEFDFSAHVNITTNPCNVIKIHENRFSAN